MLGERPAYWSDLDANGHVTNAVYGRIATDFLPAEYHSRRLRSFAINFHLEVHPDDRLQICGEPEENGFFEQGITGNNTHYISTFRFD